MTQDKPTDAQLVALAERLGWRVKALAGKWHIYHEGAALPLSWLLTPDGALGAIQAAMAGLGYTMELHAFPDTAICSFRKGNFPGWIGGKGESPEPPDAIVLAACAALGLDKEDPR